MIGQRRRERKTPVCSYIFPPTALQHHPPPSFREEYAQEWRNWEMLRVGENNNESVVKKEERNCKNGRRKREKSTWQKH